MKNRLNLATLLLLVLAGCRGDDAVLENAPLLYHRWQLVQSQEQNQPPQYVAKAIFIRFSANGRITYDESGYDGACCVPRRFSRSGPTLTPDPSTGQPDFCNYVDIACSSAYGYNSLWIIEQVDTKTLWLQIGTKRLLHNRAD